MCKQLKMSAKLLNELTTSQVEVRTSSIHGKGVFALSLLPKDVAVCVYKGVLFDVVNQDTTSVYRCQVTKTVILDGGPVESNGKYMNSPYHMGKSANVRFGKYYPASVVCEHPCFVIRANRDILPGEELLINYGRGYWGD